MSAFETLPALYAPGVAEDGATDLDTLHRTHGAWLLAFLRRRFSPQDAEDLAQETYVRAAGARTEIRNPRAFLAKVAVNAARDLARRAAVRPTLTAESDHPAALSAADQAEVLLLKQVVLGLPPALRDVFLLSRIAGLTQPEIARRLGIAQKTVEARMTKALSLCAARLQD